MEDKKVEDSSKLHVKIGGMLCAFCVKTIKKAYRKQEGVKTVNGSLSHEEALITYDPSKLSRGQIEKTLIDLGYTIHDPRKVKAFEEQQQEVTDAKQKLFVAATFTGFSLLLMIFMWIGVRLFWFKYVMMGLASATCLENHFFCLAFEWKLWVVRAIQEIQSIDTG